ncbi:MAG TPA: peroxiredoxin-like family protein [Pseudonocardia sp.]|nr:peroxiredoxin-like family protein [Pseudonocardia sp.]
MAKLTVGDTIAGHELAAIDGSTVPVPDPASTVHLQLRRFAGCPICHLHVHELARRHAEIRAAGIREVVVFHSEASTLLEYQGDLPFDVIADPDKTLYREFGVESSIRSILHPRVAAASVRGIARGASIKGGATATEDRLSMPADFLIAPDGTVLAVKYGRHADDQWSVDELLALASQGAGAA